MAVFNVTATHNLYDQSQAADYVRTIGNCFTALGCLRVTDANATMDFSTLVLNDSPTPASARAVWKMPARSGEDPVYVMLMAYQSGSLYCYTSYAFTPTTSTFYFSNRLLENGSSSSTSDTRQFVGVSGNGFLALRVGTLTGNTTDGQRIEFIERFPPAVGRERELLGVASGYLYRVSDGLKSVQEALSEIAVPRTTGVGTSSQVNGERLVRRPLLATTDAVFESQAMLMGSAVDWPAGNNTTTLPDGATYLTTAGPIGTSRLLLRTNG